MGGQIEIHTVTLVGELQPFVEKLDNGKILRVVPTNFET